MKIRAQFVSAVVALIAMAVSPATGPAAEVSEDTATVTALLKRWEQVYLGKDRKADSEFAKTFLAEEYVGITGESTIDRGGVLNSIENGVPFESYEVLERIVRINGDTAFVRELWQAKTSKVEAFQEGVKAWTTRVLLKRQGTWRLHLSQDAPVK